MKPLSRSWKMDAFLRTVLIRLITKFEVLMKEKNKKIDDYLDVLGVK